MIATALAFLSGFYVGGALVTMLTVEPWIEPLPRVLIGLVWWWWPLGTMIRRFWP